MVDEVAVVGDPAASVGDVSVSTKQSEDKSFLALKEEKRKLAEENAALKAIQAKSLEDAKLKEQDALKQQGEFKKLYETEAAERKALEEKVAKSEKKELDRKKAQAVVKELGASLKRDEYWAHIDLDKIPAVDGVINTDILKQVATEFRQNYGDLIDTKGASKGLPGHAASSASIKITKEEWLKLPTSEEKRKRVKDIIK